MQYDRSIFCKNTLKPKSKLERFGRAQKSPWQEDIASQIAGLPDHKPRPGFVAGIVIAASEDLQSFSVECQLDNHTAQIVQAGPLGSDVNAPFPPGCWRGSAGRMGQRQLFHNFDRAENAERD